VKKRKKPAKLAFTEKAIAKLPIPEAGSRPVHYYDDSTPGLGVRVETDGKNFSGDFAANPIIKTPQTKIHTQVAGRTKNPPAPSGIRFGNWALDRI
jgi:hypothetical protein